MGLPTSRFRPVASIVQRFKYSINSAIRVSTLQCIILVSRDTLAVLEHSLACWCVRVGASTHPATLTHPTRKREAGHIVPPLYNPRCIALCVCTDVLVYQIPCGAQHSATTALTVLHTHSLHNHKCQCGLGAKELPPRGEPYKGLPRGCNGPPLDVMGRP